MTYPRAPSFSAQKSLVPSELLKTPERAEFIEQLRKTYDPIREAAEMRCGEIPTRAKGGWSIAPLQGNLGLPTGETQGKSPGDHLEPSQGNPLAYPGRCNALGGEDGPDKPPTNARHPASRG